MIDDKDIKAQKLAGFVSPPTAWILWIIACFFGFLIGWYANENPESKGTCLIIAICFAIAASWPMKFWANWLQGRNAALQQMEMDELKEQANQENQLEKEREKFKKQLEKEKEKLKKQLEKQPKESSGPKKNGFTDDDFDDAAKSMLIDPVKKARKAKAKVTGQGLIDTFLKGLK